MKPMINEVTKVLQCMTQPTQQWLAVLGSMVKRVIVSNVRIFEAISPQSLADNQSGLTKLRSPGSLLPFFYTNTQVQVQKKWKIMIKYVLNLLHQYLFLNTNISGSPIRRVAVHLYLRRVRSNSRFLHLICHRLAHLQCSHNLQVNS